MTLSHDCSIALSLQHRSLQAPHRYCSIHLLLQYQAIAQHKAVMSILSSLQQAVEPEGAGPDGGSRQLVPQYDGLSNDCRRWQQLCLLGVPQCQHLSCMHSVLC